MKAIPLLACLLELPWTSFANGNKLGPLCYAKRIDHEMLGGGREEL